MYIYSRTGFAPRLRNRARGLAGAEAGGAMQAVVAGQSARGIAGAECRGSLVSYARGYAGAEARGAPAIKALGFAGAEAGGTLEPTSPAYGNGFRNYLEFLLPAASIKASGILNCLLSIDDAFPELRTVANGGLVEHASGFDMQLELADGTVVPFARLAWDATTGRFVARPRFATLPTTGARCRLFFGKTVVTDGASEGSAYVAHLMAPNIRTGADRTGLGRGWTVVSAPEDLFATPFSRYSAHHLPIGTGATYAAAGHPAMSSWAKRTTMVINVGMPYGTYVVKGNPSDPLQTVKGTGFGLPVTLRLPAGFDPGGVPGADSVVSYWNPDNGLIHDLWRFELEADGLHAAINRSYPAAELGHPDEVGERLGVSAAGVGMAFCLLRGAEINTAGTPINHALQMVMPNTGANSMLSKTTQLPAASIDGFCVTDPTNNCLGNIPYGGLFAIPPVSKGGPNLTTLGLSEAGLRLATCMRDYGVYAVDTGGNVALRADQHVTPAIRTQLVSNDLPKIYPLLKFVTNSAWTPGQTCTGGGTPIAINDGL